MIDRRGFLRGLFTGAVAAPLAAIGMASGSEPNRHGTRGGDIIVEPGAEDVVITSTLLVDGNIIIKGGTKRTVVQGSTLTRRAES